MLTLAPVVESVVAEVAPVHGVSIGTPQDKSTWRISFKSEATDQQRAAAAAVLASFDVAAEIARQALPRLETSRLRFALELRERGLWPMVKAAIEADEEASLYWELADVVASDNGLLLAMAAELGMSAAQVREIIEAAIARTV